MKMRHAMILFLALNVAWCISYAVGFDHGKQMRKPAAVPISELAKYSFRGSFAE